MSVSGPRIHANAEEPEVSQVTAPDGDGKVSTDAVTGDLSGGAERRRRRLSSLVDRRTAPGVVGTVVVAIGGFFVPSLVTSPNTMTVMLDGIILGLGALSVGFLLNLLGWVSFGGAAFSGAAAYIFAILGTSAHMSLLPALVLGILGATVTGALIGLVFVRSKALVFTMLTLALGQLLLQVVGLSGLTKYTGAASGLIVNYKGTLAGLTSVDLADAAMFWPLVWLVVVLAVAACWLISRSRFGQTLRGIRENESRLRHAGYNTYVPKVIAFTFAAFVGAFSGVFQAANLGSVSPSLFSFAACGTAIIAAIVGGYQNPFGPIIGGILMMWGQNEFGSTGQLFLYTGIALIVVLVAFPRGITGLVSEIWGWGARRIGLLAEGRLPDAGH